MCNPIFDYDDGDFIYQTSWNMRINSDGDFHMRMGDNMSMDMETGELHFNNNSLGILCFPKRFNTIIWSNDLICRITLILAVIIIIQVHSIYFKKSFNVFHYLRTPWKGKVIRLLSHTDQVHNTTITQFILLITKRSLRYRIGIKVTHNLWREQFFPFFCVIKLSNSNYLILNLTSSFLSKWPN